MKKALFSLLLTIACVPMALAQQPAGVNIVDTTITACGSYTWIDGNIYTASTVATYQSNDTLYVLDLTVEAPRVDTASAHPLTGGCSVEWNNKHWETPGFFLDTIRVPGQCDSVVKIEVVLAGVDTLPTLEATECGSYAAPWGETLTQSVSATDTVIVSASCSLTVGTLNITILQPVVSATEEIASAPGCSYSWNGIEVSEAGVVYYDTLTAANRCDSVASVMVQSFTGSTHDTTPIVACDTYTHEGTTLTADTTITTVDSSGACLAYHTLEIAIHPSYRDTAATAVRDVVAGCTYNWFGRTLTPSDINTVFYAYDASAANCDSLVAIRITSFTGVQHDTTNLDHCGRYVWNHGGRRDTITTNGEYIDTTVTSSCTNIQHLMLTFSDRYDTVKPVDSACRSYTYTFTSRDGIAGHRDRATFTESGLHTVDENNVPIYSVDFASRCTTYHAVDMYIKSPRQIESGIDIDTVVCDEFQLTFDGRQRTWNTTFDSIIMSGKYNVMICTETYGHLKLTTNHKSYNDITVKTCDYYVWEDFTNETYTRSTTVEQVLPGTTNKAGCDSIGRLNLTINYTPVVVIEGEMELVRGEANSTTLTAVCDEAIQSYKWYRNGQAQSETGNVLVVDNITDNVDIHLETTSANRCVANNYITVTYNVGIDPADAIAVNIYPNPASRYLNIESAETLQDIVVFNAIGQQVIVRNVSGDRASLDLGSLAAGNYTLRITSANGEQVTRKFIVNK